MTEAQADRGSWAPIAVLTVLLVGLVGPVFGPIAQLAKSQWGVRGGSGAVVLLFTVLFVLFAAGTLRWVAGRGGSSRDLGWRVPTRTSAVVAAALFGLFWAAFNVMGYVHQVDSTANPMELSTLRWATALGGVAIACCEDLVTRGFIMNHLKAAGVGAWLQSLTSSAVFALYHSLWTLSVAGFIVAFVYGLILSGFFVWGRRSLTPVVVAHGLALFLGEPFLTMFMLAAG